MSELLMRWAMREHIHARGRGRCGDKCVPAIVAAYNRISAIYVDRLNRLVADELARRDSWNLL